MTEVALPNVTPALADKINDALIGFTGCVGGAVDGICTYSLTFGEVYVPFKPDEDDECDEDENEDCNQLWVRVVGVGVEYNEKGFDAAPGEDGSCQGACGGTFSLDLEVGLLRCYAVPEEGEAPTATEVLGYAMQSMIDMSAIYQAATQCEVWEAIDPGQWQPEGPLGGQYGGFWTFTVQL